MRSAFAAVLILVAACALALAAPPKLAPRLAQTSFPARGTQQTLLSIPVFGRYAIAVSSPQGVALQLVDRMAGPGAVQGSPGESDGRIDAFLERGTYKIRLIADAHGAGTAALSVTPFAELQPAPLQLVEDKPVLARLADFQQRSWWLVVQSQGNYNFEAGGRYLTDLRLWKDGAWLIDAAPNVSQSGADPERPLSLMQLSAVLEPGLYRLTAYGGPGVPWPDGGADAPLQLRWGVPALSDASRTVHTASLLGIDRFIVPGTAQLVRLVLGHPEAAAVSVQPFNVDASMFDQNEADVATIDKTSRDPVAEVSPQGAAQNQPYLVTVNVTPGENYRLEVLNQQENGGWSYSADGIYAATSSTANITGSGSNLLSATLPGDPDDEIDPGFILVDNTLLQPVVASSVIDLDTALPWRRRFNLLNPVQTYLHTGKDVNLQIDGAGEDAEFVVDRFTTNASPDVVVPLPKPSGGVWQLTPGFYTLSALPAANGRGILTMSIFAQGSPPPTTDSPRLPAPIFTNVQLDALNGDTLYSSMLSGDGYGLRQLALPARLDQPLSFELGAGEAVKFPISFAEAGRLAVADESGKALAFALDGTAATGTTDVLPGRHCFSITGSGPGIAEVTLSETPLRLLAAAPLPAVPPDQATPPALPLLSPGQPDYIDLAQGASMTFDVPVREDALYRFETTGLLETGGAIRTRTNPSLASVEGNGIGRNFLLQPFLREGEYQLTVTAQGQTAGHTGIAVTETQPLDEGVLAPNQPARITLEPGQAALYHFHIVAAGTYHIFTLGLGHSFNMRLEDADGWPLIPPGGIADATLDFTPGEYRMILLPGTVENRAVTELVPIIPPVTYAGHGPFAAVFGRGMSNRWMEPAPGQPRRPDVWGFSLPAAATMTISLDGGMRGVLTHAGANTPIAVVSGSWTGSLKAGDYELSAVSAVPDNRVDYTLEIDTTELLAGQSRDVQAPETIPVSLGGGQVEISSFGDQDVRAVLYDPTGVEIAENDDRDNDWNFLITGDFPAGKYMLEVDPVGTDNAETQVSISAPVVTYDKILKLGATSVFADGLVHALPVQDAPAGELLLAGAAAAVPLGLRLETYTGGWREVSSASGMNPYLAVPSGLAGSQHRVVAWAEDHSATPVAVTAQAVNEPVGFALHPVPLGNREAFAARVNIPAPEVLDLDTADDGLQWSSQPGVAVAHDPSGTIVATGATLWLVDSAHDTVNTQPADWLGSRVRLTLGAPVALPLPASPNGQISLWTAQAQGAQPGISVGAARVMAPEPNAGLFARAIAFAPAGLANPVLNLWQAQGGQGALPVTVQRIGFAPPAAAPAGPGENDGAIPADAAVQAALPPGWKRLTLNLPAGVAAVLLRAGQTEQIIAPDGAAPDVLDTQADTLLLLNPTRDSAPYSVALQTEAGPELSLAPGGLLTPFSATPAVLHIALPGGPAARIRIAGAATAITVVDNNGAVTTGDAAQSAGGTALVTVQPGLAVVSEDGGATNQVAENVTVPGSVALAGASEFLYLPAGDARLVHFTTDTPILLRNGDIPQLFPAGAALNLFQAKGSPMDLEILPVAGSLSGTAQFDAAPAIPITDGLGPKFLVGPGESRLFTFSLDSPRRIGVGVRGSVDDADIRLLASDGTVLGSGVVAMHSLPPGTYYLAADVPANGAASIIQPALVGLTLPDDGPPPDVQENYRAMGQ